MSGIGIHISDPAKLSVKHASLYLESGKQEPLAIPLEDIDYIVLDTQQVLLSGSLLSQCAQQGCLLVTCNASHTPNGSLLPFHTFYRQQETLQAQLDLTLPKKKRLWQQIVRHKILNQAACLHWTKISPNIAEKIIPLEKRVKSGDPENTEALAARYYFRAYMQGNRRDSQGKDRLNALLNYGYALIRAAIARNLVALGFIPCLGVHHHSMGNAFNLADDLIEPWRPFVDAHAMPIFLQRKKEPELVKEDRQDLSRIFQFQIFFENGVIGLLQALQRQTTQLRGFYLGGALPDFPKFLCGEQKECQQTE